MVVESDTVVWLAGIRTHDLLLRLGVPVHPRGGVEVERTLAVKGATNVFAAGDCVMAQDAETGKIAPDVVYAALQQGSVVVQNVLRRLRGKNLISYLDRPRPTYATVGGKFALVHLPPFQFAGRLGWAIKQCADLWYLFSILPNDVAARTWLKNVRVRIAND
jgi:NADH dehydrogenase